MLTDFMIGVFWFITIFAAVGLAFLIPAAVIYAGMAMVVKLVG